LWGTCSADHLILIQEGGEVAYLDVAAKIFHKVTYNNRFPRHLNRKVFLEIGPAAQLLFIGFGRRKCIHYLALIGDAFTTTFSGIANLGTPRRASIDATKIVATGDITLYITCLWTLPSSSALGDAG
jgi:hypothetical protein